MPVNQVGYSPTPCWPVKVRRETIIPMSFQHRLDSLFFRSLVSVKTLSLFIDLPLSGLNRSCWLAYLLYSSKLVCQGFSLTNFVFPRNWWSTGSSRFFVIFLADRTITLTWKPVFTRCYPSIYRVKKSAPIKKRKSLLAMTYSPRRLPSKYHRRWRA